jgi:AhpD family alkylhydroperoxidase
MPRIEPFAGTPADPLFAKLLADGERDGTPDERMIRVFARSEIGAKWIDFCHTSFTEGLLPHTLKELIRIRMSVAEECGYCSSLRSKRAAAEGLTEEIVMQMTDLDDAPDLSERDKAALRYADLYKHGQADSDEAFDALRRHFSDEEIIELGVVCSVLAGGGQFAKSLQVLSWAQACEVRPTLTTLLSATTTEPVPA